MWKQISLRNRIILLQVLLLMIILAGGSIMIWYTHRLESLFTSFIDKDIAALKAVEALESDLANQKGFVSYYFLDGNPDWLQQLEKYRQSFDQHLNEARGYMSTKSERKAIDQIDSEYQEYIKNKDQVIALYKAGKKKAGAKLHQQVRKTFFKILQLSENYKKIHFEKINLTRQKSRAQARHLRIIAGMAMLSAVFLSIILAMILMNQIFGPVRKLTLEINRSQDKKKPGDEVVTLRDQVYDLIKDMEKFASVGKLAAGVAHSVRNPLASVKMRLFSLERSLELSPLQKADFDVISEEIRHINNIVQNFLEFSRPSKLEIQKVSPSDIVDDALLLLRDRLKSYNVDIELKRQERLPEIFADPEQLKEVLVNLIVNACEAMVNGGSIIIHEEKEHLQKTEDLVVIRIRDEGPGIPESIRKKIFQPFFTCKENGTGLGLTIAARIVNEHGGWLDFKSKEGEGTTFIIKLPLKREKNGHNFNC